MKTDPKLLSINKLKKFIANNYLKNRTIVSQDIPKIFDDIETVTGLPVKRYKFHTGEDHGTWIVPPRWDVKEAWLKDDKGNVLASYKDHPLFVSPYSKSVHTRLNKDELLTHTVFESKQPNAFAYNWRYAYDARLRLKDWGISLPYNRIKKLGNGPFEIKISVEVEDGDMLIGEITLPGKCETTILFIANYCHPGQVNDSFSGLAAFMKVIHDLSQQDNHFTYRLVFCPETIGSAIYIASDPIRVQNVKGAIFSEMVCWGDEWFIKKTRKGNSYFDLLASESSRNFKDIKLSNFFSLIGNDEYILDSVQVGIPTLSLQKYPFIEYHTSNDEPSRIVDSDLQRASEIILHMVDVIEQDRLFEFTGPVPFWMTRYDLYSDDQYEPEEFIRNFNIVYRYLDGQRSVLEISELVNSSFETVYEYIRRMEKNGLVREVGRLLG